jgi:hypothetical protein
LPLLLSPYNPPYRNRRGSAPHNENCGSYREIIDLIGRRLVARKRAHADERKAGETPPALWVRERTAGKEAYTHARREARWQTGQ